LAIGCDREGIDADPDDEAVGAGSLVSGDEPTNKAVDGREGVAVGVLEIAKPAT
jgi:hypothetical protein